MRGFADYAPGEATGAELEAPGSRHRSGVAGEGRGPRRRAYRPPRLVAHGELASLIRLQPVAGTDDPGGFGTLPGS